MNSTRPCKQAQTDTVGATPLFGFGILALELSIHPCHPLVNPYQQTVPNSLKRG